MWINLQNTVFYELWQKEFRIGPVIFEFRLNLFLKTAKSDTKVRTSNLVEKPLSVTPWRLSTGLIEQFLKYLESGNQPFQLFTRIAAWALDQFSFLENFLMLKLYNNQHTVCSMPYLNKLIQIYSFSFCNDIFSKPRVCLHDFLTSEHFSPTLVP